MKNGYIKIQAAAYNGGHKVIGFQDFPTFTLDTYKGLELKPATGNYCENSNLQIRRICNLRSMPVICKYTAVLHIFAQVLFWNENQGNHQIFDPFLLLKKL